MTFYNSDSIPEWKNNIFIGGLSSMHIARLVLENNKVVGERRLLTGEKQRFRDVTQGNDGCIICNNRPGQIIPDIEKIILVHRGINSPIGIQQTGTYR